MTVKPKGVLDVISRLILRKAQLVAYSAPETEPIADVTEANVVTSKLTDVEDRHYVLVDVDFPVYVLPSSTPGHSHLYIEKAVSEARLMELLDAMVTAGLVEEGYAIASRARGYSALRLPWVKKPQGAAAPEPAKKPAPFPFLDDAF